MSCGIWDWTMCVATKRAKTSTLSSLHVERPMLTSQDRSCYTPWVDEFMLSAVNHVGPRRSLTAQLGERGVSSKDIDTVLFRYVTPETKEKHGAQLCHLSTETVTPTGITAVPFETYFPTQPHSSAQAQNHTAAQATHPTRTRNGMGGSSTRCMRPRSGPN